MDRFVTTAIDTTLLLGAESYLTSGSLGGEFPIDPAGRECLQTFIDLLINAQEVHIALPTSSKAYMPLLYTTFKKRLIPLHGAAIPIESSLKSKILLKFASFVEQHHSWMSDWIAFQLCNPIVTKGHTQRIGKKGSVLPMISAESYEFWKEQGNDLPAQLSGDLRPKVRQYHLSPAKTKAITSIGMSQDQFILCYAFDVYLRGWQYFAKVGELANSTMQLQATYFPHPLRNDALEAGSSGWRSLVDHRQLWSWGAYILELFEEPEFRKYGFHHNPEKLLEYVTAICEEVQAGHCPRWIDVSLLDENGSPRKNAFRKGEQERILAAAKKIGLPLLRLQRDPKLISRLNKGKNLTTIGKPLLAGSESVVIETGLTLLTSSRITYAIIKMLPSSTVNRLGFRWEVMRRRALAPWCKGTFGYRGLIPNGN